jgi:hypothetical protein
LDSDRFELRKVEIWADGRAGYAGPNCEYGGTRLGLEPVPTFEEIAADPEFKPVEVTQAEFEAIWQEKAR